MKRQRGQVSTITIALLLAGLIVGAGGARALGVEYNVAESCRM